MVGVRAKCEPDNEERRQSGRDSSSENQSYNLGRRAGVFTEDVVDLLLRSVAEGLLGNGERDVGIAGNAQVKNLSLVWRGGSKGSNDDGGGNRLRGSEELVGEILVHLLVSVVVLQLLSQYAPSSHCLCRYPSR